MRRDGLLARLAGVLAAFGLVVGAGAVLVFVAGLGSGDVTARRVVGAVVGAAVAWAVMRFVPIGRLLGGYSALVYAFLLIPILVVVIYAFNDNRIVTVWEGFTTRWFGEALRDESITSAIGRSLRIAVASAIVATVFGTAAAIGLSKAPRRLRVPFDVLVFLTLVVPELVL